MNAIDFIHEHVFHLLIFGYWAAVFLGLLLIYAVGKLAESDINLL